MYVYFAVLHDYLYLYIPLSFNLASLFCNSAYNAYTLNILFYINKFGLCVLFPVRVLLIIENVSLVGLTNEEVIHTPMPLLLQGNSICWMALRRVKYQRDYLTREMFIFEYPCWCDNVPCSLRIYWIVYDMIVFHCSLNIVHSDFTPSNYILCKQIL